MSSMHRLRRSDVRSAVLEAEAVPSTRTLATVGRVCMHGRILLDGSDADAAAAGARKPV